MSNVLIGIVGVMLFIGLALAGASFFGPVVGDSVQDARAMSVMKTLSSTVVAVHDRNRDLETTTPAAPTAAALAPDFLDEEPLNPVNGNPVMLITKDAQTSGGPASYVVTKLAPREDQVRICEFLSRSGGGSVPVGYMNSMPNQTSGCGRVGMNYGPFSVDDYVAFYKI